METACQRCSTKIPSEKLREIPLRSFTLEFLLLVRLHLLLKTLTDGCIGNNVITYRKSNMRTEPSPPTEANTSRPPFARLNAIS